MLNVGDSKFLRHKKLKNISKLTVILRIEEGSKQVVNIQIL